MNEKYSSGARFEPQTYMLKDGRGTVPLSPMGGGGVDVYTVHVFNRSGTVILKAYPSGWEINAPPPNLRTRCMHRRDALWWKQSN